MKKLKVSLIIGLLALAAGMAFGGIGGLSGSSMLAVMGMAFLGEVQTAEGKELADGLVKVKDLFSQFKTAQESRLQKLEKGEAVPESIELKLNQLETALTDADAKYQKMVDDNEALEAKVNQMNELVVDKKDENRMDEFKAAFEYFARKGDDNVQARNAKGQPITIGDSGAPMYMKEYLEDLQMKTMSAGSDPDGGYMIPDPVAKKILEIMTETSPIRAEANVENISIDEYTYLIDEGEVGAGWVGEHDTRPKTDTSKMGKGRITAHEIYANPFATQKMLDDSSFNVQAWLQKKIGTKFNLLESTAFVLGNGIAKPRGFMTYESGSAINQVLQLSQGEAAAITNADGLINLQTALESWYGANAKWYMRRATVGNIRKLKDTTGQYIWQPGVQAGQPSVLLGDPIVKCADMPAVAANSLPICYGNMREAYTIVDRVGIRVLRDPYTSKPYIQFYTTKRVGGALVNGKALKILKVQV